MEGVRRTARMLSRPVATMERKAMGGLGGAGLRLPTFMCIGAPQAATTWLFENLRLHPDVHIPIKEARFFDALTHRPLAWYSSLYRKSACGAVGDMSTSYCRLNPRQIRFIRRIMPDVRLIFIVRDPVERAWSGFRRRAGSNVSPTEGDVREYLAWTVRTRNARTQAPLEYSQYSTVLDNWLWWFDPESVLVVRFQDIAADPRSTLSMVLRHIDVDVQGFPWGWEVIESVNRNQVVAMPEEVKGMLQSRYAQEYYLIGDLL